MMKRSIFVALLLLLASAHGRAPAQDVDGRYPPTPGVRGAELAFLAAREKPRNISSLYDGSYALLIGIDYANSEAWPYLKGVAADIAAVRPALERHGFKVEEARGGELTADALRARIRDFVATRGGPDSRLLVYYAGHGYREKDGSAGYIVAQDAPRPGAPGFRDRAVSMAEIRAFSEKAKAKHLLLVFDSCFSGTMINGVEAASSAAPAGQTAADCSRVELARGGGANLPSIPRNIICASQSRVREFIASGTDRQLVKDDSDFRRKFVLALTDESGRGADLDADGYVTGRELGLYIQSKVTNLSEGQQMPTSGFIGPQSENQGDFVFVMPGASALEESIKYGDADLWDCPVCSEGGRAGIVARGPGLMLPREAVRHSFRDFELVTRVRLRRNLSAQLVLRAQTPEDFYLVEINGGSCPDVSARLTVRAYVMLEGKKFPVRWVEGGGGETAAPLPAVVADALNHEKELQLNVTVIGGEIGVSFVSTDSRSKTAPSGRVLYALRFRDEKKTFTYGMPGFRLEGPEELEVSTISVSKIDRTTEGVK